jgi:hypothetical protein
VKRQKKQSESERLRPLWGFGWPGWVALAVLGLELFWLYVDPDPVRSFQAALAQLGAWTINPVTFWIMGLQMQFAFVALHPLTAWPLFMALVIHPRHTEWWRWAALMIATILSPLVWMHTTTIARSVWDAIAWSGLPMPVRPASWTLPVEFYCVVTGQLGAAAIWCAVRSRTVAFLMLLLGFGWGFVVEYAYTKGFSLPWVYSITINLTISVVALVSAIRARRRWKPAYACSRCGYDLRNLPNDTTQCPECGQSPRRTPA